MEEKHTADLVKQPLQPNKEGNEDELKSTKDGSFETNQFDEKTSSTLSLKDEASLLKQAIVKKSENEVKRGKLHTP